MEILICPPVDFTVAYFIDIIIACSIGVAIGQFASNKLFKKVD